jgi:hypothetical protein
VALGKYSIEAVSAAVGSAPGGTTGERSSHSIPLAPYCRVNFARGARRLLLGGREKWEEGQTQPGHSARALLASGVIPEGEQGSVQMPGEGLHTALGPEHPGKSVSK